MRGTPYFMEFIARLLKRWQGWVGVVLNGCGFFYGLSIATFIDVSATTTVKVVPTLLAIVLGSVLLIFAAYKTFEEERAKNDQRATVTLTVGNGDEFDETIQSFSQHDPSQLVGQRFTKTLVVTTNRKVEDCRVYVNNISKDGITCPQFRPTYLRWHGKDGDGSDSNTFPGSARVLFLSRMYGQEMCELQAPHRDFIGVNFWYPEGLYCTEFIVTAKNSEDKKMVALVHIGVQPTDISMQAA